MNTTVERTQNHISLLFSNLLHGDRRTSSVATAKQSQITLFDLATMPRDNQLLIAHCLEQDNPNLTLLDSDTDVRKLVSAGFLTLVPCSTVGISCFKIKPHIWAKLRWMQEKFLTKALLADLFAYRRRQSALYPWLW